MEVKKADTIKMMKIGEIIPYSTNPRKIEKAIGAVIASIKAFGFKIPIIIDKNNVVVAGHVRLKAAEVLGMQELPCIVADDLTPEQIDMFRIADNKVAEQSKWDIGLLKQELETLKQGFDLKSFGFTDKDLAKLFSDTSFGQKPEIQFTEEILESHNYVVLYFDNDVDWLQAITLLDIKPVAALDAKIGWERSGVGRVINGAEFFRKVLKSL
jgi:ParB family transcriptional regulator, chromosome partitioning protein